MPSKSETLVRLVTRWMIEPCLEFTNIYIYVNKNFLQLPPYNDYIVYELAPPDRKTFVSWRYLKELEIGKKKILT